MIGLDWFLKMKRCLGREGMTEGKGQIHNENADRHNYTYCYYDMNNYANSCQQK